ncbi:MAG TPA: DNA polymerase III subunit gamma/tau [Planctomycetota bacterium]|nr:DNA polymerase III subunit gamma/tau [Planctomycetota bacterium]
MSTEATYTVLARRYRPLSFDDVVGQEHVSRTLKNAIADKRVGHAYLFCGPRGVGKTSMARLFAKALNCAQGPTDSPCNACEICLAVHEGTDTDVIEMDAASNRSVDDARSLREGIRYSPLRSRSKVYIIDEAHMLTREAFNTLLKTLEEPPPHVKFFFATTEAHKLPDTIVSRCQRFDFRRITTADIVRRLRQVVDGEKIAVDDRVLAAIARSSHGGMRDAESLLDQLISFKAKGLTEEDVAAVIGEARGTHLADLLGAVRAGDAGKVFSTLAAIFGSGVDVAAFTDQLLERFRALLAVKAVGKNADIVDLPEADLAEVEMQASGLTLEALLYFIQLTLEAKRRIKEGANPRIVLEVTLVKMSRSADLVTLSEVLRGTVVTAAPAAPAAAPAALAAAKPVEPESSADSDEPVPLAPAAPPAAAPSFSGVPTSLEEAQGAWPRVVAAVKEKSVLAATLLREGRVSKFSADEIGFAMPPQFKDFHVKQLEHPKNKAVIDAALQSVFGRRVALRVTLESSGAPGPATPPKRPADTAADPGVKKILEAFGGSKVVGIE